MAAVPDDVTGFCVCLEVVAGVDEVRSEVGAGTAHCKKAMESQAKPWMMSLVILMLLFLQENEKGVKNLIWFGIIIEILDRNVIYHHLVVSQYFIFVNTFLQKWKEGFRI